MGFGSLRFAKEQLPSNPDNRKKILGKRDDWVIIDYSNFIIAWIQSCESIVILEQYLTKFFLGLRNTGLNVAVFMDGKLQSYDRQLERLQRKRKQLREAIDPKVWAKSKVVGDNTWELWSRGKKLLNNIFENYEQCTMDDGFNFPFQLAHNQYLYCDARGEADALIRRFTAKLEHACKHRRIQCCIISADASLTLGINSSRTSLKLLKPSDLLMLPDPKPNGNIKIFYYPKDEISPVMLTRWLNQIDPNNDYRLVDNRLIDACCATRPSFVNFACRYFGYGTYGNSSRTSQIITAARVARWFRRKNFPSLINALNPETIEGALSTTDDGSTLFGFPQVINTSMDPDFDPSREMFSVSCALANIRRIRAHVIDLLNYIPDEESMHVLDSGNEESFDMPGKISTFELVNPLDSFTEELKGLRGSPNEFKAHIGAFQQAANDLNVAAYNDLVNSSILVPDENNNALVAIQCIIDNLEEVTPLLNEIPLTDIRIKVLQYNHGQNAEADQPLHRGYSNGALQEYPNYTIGMKVIPSREYERDSICQSTICPFTTGSFTSPIFNLKARVDYFVEKLDQQQDIPISTDMLRAFGIQEVNDGYVFEFLSALKAFLMHNLRNDNPLDYFHQYTPDDFELMGVTIFSTALAFAHTIHRGDWAIDDVLQEYGRRSYVENREAILKDVLKALMSTVLVNKHISDELGRKGIHRIGAITYSYGESIKRLKNSAAIRRGSPEIRRLRITSILESFVDTISSWTKRLSPNGEFAMKLNPSLAWFDPIGVWTSLVRRSDQPLWETDYFSHAERERIQAASVGVDEVLHSFTDVILRLSQSFPEPEAPTPLERVSSLQSYSEDFPDDHDDVPSGDEVDEEIINMAMVATADDGSVSWQADHSKELEWTTPVRIHSGGDVPSDEEEIDDLDDYYDYNYEEEVLEKAYLGAYLSNQSEGHRRKARQKLFSRTGTMRRLYKPDEL